MDANKKSWLLRKIVSDELFNRAHDIYYNLEEGYTKIPNSDRREFRLMGVSHEFYCWRKQEVEAVREWLAEWTPTAPIQELIGLLERLSERI